MPLLFLQDPSYSATDIWPPQLWHPSHRSAPAPLTAVASYLIDRHESGTNLPFNSQREYDHNSNLDFKPLLFYFSCIFLNQCMLYRVTINSLTAHYSPHSLAFTWRKLYLRCPHKTKITTVQNTVQKIKLLMSKQHHWFQRLQIKNATKISSGEESLCMSHSDDDLMTCSL